MDHLSPLDKTFLVLERDNLPMHIGGLLILDGPAPSFGQFLRLLESRLDQIPRYRQVISRGPLGLGPPAWLDDPHFDLRYHVRNTAVPRTGTDEQLRTLTSRVLSARLDLARPPWELWLIEGLAHGRFAVVSKVHHSMVDGLSSADLLEVLLDPTPQVNEHPPHSHWTPKPWPSYQQRLIDTLEEGIREPAVRLRQLTAYLDAPRDAAKRVVATAGGMLRVGQTLAHSEDHLMGQPGRHRRWAWAQGDLETVKSIKRALGGTVNDVILASVAGGFRAFLLGRGVNLGPLDSVRSMVPVSTRTPDGPKGGNEVAALFTDLPVGIEDPAERLSEVRERMRRVKGSGLLQGTDSLLANAAFVPQPLFAAAGRLAARAPQPMVATITTNVPGAQRQLYLMGRPLLRVLPYVPLGMNQLITVAIISYNGHLDCGITADYERVPDIQVMADGIENSLSELASRVSGSPPHEPRERRFEVVS